MRITPNDPNNKNNQTHERSFYFPNNTPAQTDQLWSLSNSNREAIAQLTTTAERNFYAVIVLSNKMPEKNFGQQVAKVRSGLNLLNLVAHSINPSAFTLQSLNPLLKNFAICNASKRHLVGTENLPDPSIFAAYNERIGFLNASPMALRLSINSLDDMKKAIHETWLNRLLYSRAIELIGEGNLRVAYELLQTPFNYSSDVYVLRARIAIELRAPDTISYIKQLPNPLASNLIPHLTNFSIDLETRQNFESILNKFPPSIDQSKTNAFQLKSLKPFPLDPLTEDPRFAPLNLSITWREAFKLRLFALEAKPNDLETIMSFREVVSKFQDEPNPDSYNLLAKLLKEVKELSGILELEQRLNDPLLNLGENAKARIKTLAMITHSSVLEKLLKDFPKLMEFPVIEEIFYFQIARLISKQENSLLHLEYALVSTSEKCPLFYLLRIMILGRAEMAKNFSKINPKQLFENLHHNFIEYVNGLSKLRSQKENSDLVIDTLIKLYSYIFVRDSVSKDALKTAAPIVCWQYYLAMSAIFRDKPEYKMYRNKAKELSLQPLSDFVSSEDLLTSVARKSVPWEILPEHQPRIFSTEEEIEKIAHDCSYLKLPQLETSERQVIAAPLSGKEEVRELSTLEIWDGRGFTEGLELLNQGKYLEGWQLMREHIAIYESRKISVCKSEEHWQANLIASIVTYDPVPLNRQREEALEKFPKETQQVINNWSKLHCAGHRKTRKTEIETLSHLLSYSNFLNDPVLLRLVLDFSLRYWDLIKTDQEVISYCSAIIKLSSRINNPHPLLSWISIESTRHLLKRLPINDRKPWEEKQEQFFDNYIAYRLDNPVHTQNDITIDTMIKASFYAATNSEKAKEHLMKAESIPSAFYNLLMALISDDEKRIFYSNVADKLLKNPFRPGNIFREDDMRELKYLGNAFNLPWGIKPTSAFLTRDQVEKLEYEEVVFLTKGNEVQPQSSVSMELLESTAQIENIQKGLQLLNQNKHIEGWQLFREGVFVYQQNNRKKPRTSSDPNLALAEVLSLIISTSNLGSHEQQLKLSTQNLPEKTREIIQTWENLRVAKSLPHGNNKWFESALKLINLGFSEDPVLIRTIIEFSLKFIIPRVSNRHITCRVEIAQLISSINGFNPVLHWLYLEAIRQNLNFSKENLKTAFDSYLKNSKTIKYTKPHDLFADTMLKIRYYLCDPTQEAADNLKSAASVPSVFYNATMAFIAKKENRPYSVFLDRASQLLSYPNASLKVVLENISEATLNEIDSGTLNQALEALRKVEFIPNLINPTPIYLSRQEVQKLEETELPFIVSPTMVPSPARPIIPSQPQSVIPISWIEQNWFKNKQVYFQWIKELVEAKGEWRLKLPTTTQRIPEEVERYFSNSAPVLDEETRLSTFHAEEVAPTLLKRKLAFFLHRFQNLNQFLEVEKADQTMRTRPFLLMNQNVDKIHAYLFVAHFAGPYTLIAIGNDSKKGTEGYLKTLFPDLQVDEKQQSVNFTFDEFEKLKESIEFNDGLPSCLLFNRSKHEDTFAEVHEKEMNSRKRKSERVDTEEEIHERKQRRDSGYDPMEVVENYSTKASSSQVTLTSVEVQNGQKNASTYKNIHQHRPLNQVVEFPNLPPTSGEVPALNAPMHKDVMEIDFSANPLAFWINVHQKDTHVLRQNVAAQVARRRALKNEILPFKILQEIERVPEKAPSLYHWLPFLKTYQRDVIEKIWNLMNHGLSPIISLEMGLGKTFTSISTAFEAIYRGHTGTFLIVVPNAIVEQTKDEYLTAISEMQLPLFIAHSSAQELLIKLVNAQDKKVDLLLRALYYKKERPLENSAHLVRLFMNIDHAAKRVQKNVSEQLALDPSFEKLVEIFKQEHGNLPYLDQVFNGIAPKLSSKKEQIDYILFLGKVLSIGKEIPQTPPYKKDKNLDLLMEVLGEDVIAETKSTILLNHLQKPSEKPRFIITTIEGISPIEMKQVPSHVRGLVIDEAHRYVNETTDAHQCIKRFITGVRGNCEAAKKLPFVLMLTGTPIVNDFADALQLLILQNPKLLAKSDLTALEASINNLIQKVVSPKGELEDEYTTKLVNFLQLKKLFQSLILYLRKEHPQVEKDWNGMFPTYIEKIVDGTPWMNEGINKKLEEAHTTYKKDKNLFTYQSQVKKFLIHPELPRLDHESPEVKGFLDRLTKDPEEILRNSPLLQFIDQCQELHEAIRQGERTLILVENKVQMQVLEIFLKHKFQRSDLAREFDGDLNLHQKSAWVKWFNETPSAIGLFSIKAGGVGLNLGKGKLVIVLTNNFEPALEQQAFARVLRPGKVKEQKTFLIPEFSTHFGHHQSKIYKIKELLMQMFFESDEMFFDSFAKFIKRKISHEYLLRLKDKEKAKQCSLAPKQKLQTFLLQHEQIKQDAHELLTSLKTQRALTRPVKHIEPPPSVHLPQIKMDDFWLLPGLTKAHAIAIGALFYANQTDSKEDQQRFYQACDQVHKSVNKETAYTLLEERIKKLPANFVEGFSLEEYIAQNGVYQAISKTNPTLPRTIRVLSIARGTGTDYAYLVRHKR